MTRAKKPPRVKMCPAISFPEGLMCELPKGHTGRHVALRLHEPKPKKKGARK